MRAQPRNNIWRCKDFVFDQPLPLIMGILNVTPDSFSDGGAYLGTSQALAHAQDMLDAGADIIDVGGESTRPGSQEVDVSEELARVLPVVRDLARKGVCVSIDSRHFQTVAACLREGASIINDITGFADRSMLELAASSKVGCVVMHMRGNPKTMQEDPHYDDVVSEVSAFLLDHAHRLEQAGVEHDRICIDPGPGFGKNYDQNLALLKATDHFANLGDSSYPPYLLMAAWSKKRFVGQMTGVEEASERMAGSVTTALLAAGQGAGVLRIHDVAPTVEALKVMQAAGYFG
ncbi:MAG: dihydropteroate synthase [Coriobacteriales bacterium]|nr:dihydropteroate synthase [Coriobacteriales bacterium]